MEWMWISIGLVSVLAVLWLIVKYMKQLMHNKLAEQEKALASSIAVLEKEKALAQMQLADVQNVYQQTLQQLSKETEKYQQLSSQYAVLQTQNTHLSERLDTQKKELTELQQHFTKEFENIANRILKQNSSDFTDVNVKHLTDIVNPLKDKISLFEKKVEDAYDKELRDKLSLREEVRKLTELNTRISEEATNLTKALKGDVKKQGNWGEIVLERVLERSGLRKGIEYTREEQIEGDVGQVYRPDVIVHLPDNKHIIVDSKVSLLAYENFVNANDDEKDAYLKAHIVSLRNHIKGLGEKCYQNSPTLNSPDFVLMFLPIEGSFSVALQSDNEIYSFAWDRKIVVVSPTTLLATLRTIASIWKQENQTKNAQEIARLGGALYDKLVGCVEDLNKVKLNIDRASASHNDAMKKLQLGAGNVFVTAEKMKQLGAKTSKQLPEDLQE
ncbi:MAG TPA: DNA recombination protein RmuC [Paludibacteraceae bacterium]|nr:DNA recombination protein RmuC [Paludibacteraceae bacterium]HPL93747.1 DNA recombination protein RmuC [Paludibacteraceae bacterium]